MKISLVYVGIGIAGFNPNRPPGDREGSWIGHGIASIGANLKVAGHEVDLIDLRQLAGWEDLSAKIQANPADVYGLSVSAVDHYAALKTVVQIKRNAPESWVIVGGIHPSIFPQEYDYQAIDTLVSGEGEIIFADLVRKIEYGQPLPRLIQGEKPDLNGIPWVDRELFNYKREMECFFAPGQQTPSITMLAGRGCAFKCSYCQPAENAIFGKPYRMRSPENVIAELDMLKGKYDFKSITFWDDTFTFNKKWIMQFCDLYESRNYGATIAACSRADIICKNEKMVERMASIGVDWFVIGFESGSQRLLDLIKKGTTIEQNKRAAEICRKYGIKIFATYMYGLPTESERESLATAEMIRTIHPEHNSPFWYVPIKGTNLYDYCVEHSLLLEESQIKTIERTGKFQPTLKDINYNYISQVMQYGFQ